MGLYVPATDGANCTVFIKEEIKMNIKKLAAILCALSMTTAMFASCGDTDSSSDTDTTASKAADATTDDTAESTADEESEAEVEIEDDVAEWEPITEFTGYDAFLMFGDMDWLWGNWNGTGYTDTTEAYGCDADITGDGEYTVSITRNSIVGTDDNPNQNVSLDEAGYANPATGTVVFCVDITGICDGTTAANGEATKKNKLKEGDDNNVNVKTIGDYTGQELTVTVTSIKADGEEVEFDPSKILYGNIEDDNNKYRIEIYNDYGDTAADSPIDQNALYFEDSLEVTFTIEGLGEVKTFSTASADDTDAEEAAEESTEDTAEEASEEAAE